MNNTMLRVNLLLDDASRNKLRVSVNNLINYEVNVVKSLRELSEVALNKSKTVVILEEYVRTTGALSELMLYKEVYGLNYIYLGLDPLTKKLVEDLATCHNIDASMVNYERLYAVTYEDKALIKRLSSEERLAPVLEFAHTVKESEDYSANIRELASTVIAFEQEVHRIKMEETTQKEKIELLQSEYELAKSSYSELESLYIELIGNAKQLNRTLKQYEAILAPDYYEKVALNRYANAPMIIYLKEYEELLHMNSFITTLFNVLRYQFRRSVKVVRLHDSEGSRRLLTIPPIYHKVNNSFKETEVISHDFLLKVGPYKEVFDTLLRNENNLDILIVVDCKSHLDVVLSGKYIHLSMCRNVKHLPLFNLDGESTIVNNDKESPLSWDHYAEYAKLGDEELFSYLSSRPVIQSIYTLVDSLVKVGV